MALVERDREGEVRATMNGIEPTNWIWHFVDCSLENGKKGNAIIIVDRIDRYIASEKKKSWNYGCWNAKWKKKRKEKNTLQKYRFTNLLDFHWTHRFVQSAAIDYIEIKFGKILRKMCTKVVITHMAAITRQRARTIAWRVVGGSMCLCIS